MPSILLAALTLIGVTLIEPPTRHMQGIDVEGHTIWVTAVDRETRAGWISRYDVDSGRRLATAEVQDGDRFHPGGIQLDGDAVWLPVAEYRRASSTRVQKRDKITLALRAQFDVPDHIGCLAVADGVIWGGNWDSTHFYRWRADGTLIDRRVNPTGTRYQDLKWIDGLLVGAGLGGPDHGTIDWIDPATLVVVKRIVTGVTDRGVPFTNEGMAIRAGVLYLLPEDDHSRLFRYRLP